MTNLQNLTVEQLRKVVAIKEQIESLEAQLTSIAGGDSPVGAATTVARRRKMSRAARASIAAAQRARWAKLKAGDSKKRKVSAATRAKMAANARARWARVKAAGKSTL